MKTGSVPAEQPETGSAVQPQVPAATLPARSGPGLGWDIWILTACQFFYYIGMSIDLTLTAIVGLRVAPTLALATVPLGAMSVVAVTASYGAGVLASRFGYTKVLVAGAAAAVTGGLVSVWAVEIHSFPMLCAGTATVGLYKSTGGYFRFLAADRSPADRRNQAISAVLLGGVAAAVVGPLLATGSSHLLGVVFAASYLMVACVAAPVIPLILMLRRNPAAQPAAQPAEAARPAAQPAEADEPAAQPAEPAGAPPGGVLAPVPIRAVARLPVFQQALGLLLVAQGVMMLVMSTAPLVNMTAGHSMSDNTTMVQLHLMGMFVPSLFSGRLVTRWGAGRTGLAGTALMASGTLVGAFGTQPFELMTAMALVGVAWNIMYVAGTALVVSCYQPGRGGRVQAASEGLSGAFAALASISSSAVLSLVGWNALNAIATSIALVLLLWLSQLRQNAGLVGAPQAGA